MKKPKSPFLKVLDKHRFLIGVFIVMLLAVYFRFWSLAVLPPGLHPEEAAHIDTIINYIGQFPGILKEPLEGHNLYYLLVQTLSVKLLGFNVFALRLVSALAGTVGVLFTYLWIKRWFGQSQGLIAALLLAITPWTVGLSRLGYEAGLVLLAVPLFFYLTTLGLDQQRKRWFFLAGLGLAVLYAPTQILQMLLFGVALLLAFVFKGMRLDKWRLQAALLGLLGAILGFIPVVIQNGFNLSRLVGESARNSLAGLRPGGVVQNLGEMLLAFNWRGDDSWLFNISSQPLFNLFVSTMLLLGILVTFSKLFEFKYWSLLALFAVGILSGAVFGELALSTAGLLAATAAVALAAVGIGYMLETWYATFPINSAARTLGTVPIVLLLAISVYQGSKHYFVAWGGSPEVYAAYDQATSAVADFLKEQSFEGQRYVFLGAGSERAATVRYLTHQKAGFQFVSPDTLETVLSVEGPKQFVVLSDQEAAILKTLQEKYPKAKLTRHYSKYNDDAELFIIYEVK